MQLVWNGSQFSTRCSVNALGTTRYCITSASLSVSAWAVMTWLSARTLSVVVFSCLTPWVFLLFSTDPSSTAWWATLWPAVITVGRRSCEELLRLLVRPPATLHQDLTPDTAPTSYCINKWLICILPSWCKHTLHCFTSCQRSSMAFFWLDFIVWVTLNDSGVAVIYIACSLSYLGSIFLYCFYSK